MSSRKNQPGKQRQPHGANAQTVHPSFDNMTFKPLNATCRKTPQDRTAFAASTFRAFWKGVIYMTMKIARIAALLAVAAIAVAALTGCSGAGSETGQYVPDLSLVAHQPWSLPSADPLVIESDADTWFTIQGTVYEVRPAGGVDESRIEYHFYRQTGFDYSQEVTPTILWVDAETGRKHFKFAPGQYIAKARIPFEGTMLWTDTLPFTATPARG